ncbi:protein STPG3-like [Polypterus senegalus]|uniref:protein STPG3-like n=1 Tax=Polypterus senegalus TaxID=55291 RepID=UPI001964592D|nr:protein STPG3-like [Polypterus senegalus]
MEVAGPEDQESLTPDSPLLIADLKEEPPSVTVSFQVKDDTALETASEELLAEGTLHFDDPLQKDQLNPPSLEETKHKEVDSHHAPATELSIHAPSSDLSSQPVLPKSSVMLKNRISKKELAERSSWSTLRTGDTTKSHLSLPALVTIKRIALWNSGRLRKSTTESKNEGDANLKSPGLRETLESRPPLSFNLTGPGPTTYTPSTWVLSWHVPPAYTFGSTMPIKKGGGRTSWEKSWFQGNRPFTTQTTFEDQWPSPAHYKLGSTLGPHQPVRFKSPCYTFGNKQHHITMKAGPPPNKYEIAQARRQVWPTSPAFTIQRRVQGTQLWPKRDVTPGPGTYQVSSAYLATRPHQPAHTIRGSRIATSHQLLFFPHVT